MQQLSFIDSPVKSTGRDLRDKGIERALKHAEQVRKVWAFDAENFLFNYAREHKVFLGEDVRMASMGIVPEPPSLRAWGAILLRGSHRGWIRQIGYAKVQNEKAHCANAALWESQLVK